MALLKRHPFIAAMLKLSIKTWVLVLSLAIALTVVSFILVGALGFADKYYHVAGDETSMNKILSIKVSGVIVGDSDEGFAEGFGVVPGYAIKQQLYKAADDDAIQGVVLEINSPGGTIYGAHAIADGVAHYREKAKRPVYAHVQGVGASGAYWAAISADKVITDYGSDVGSIGVIMGPFKYYDKVLSEDGKVLTQNGIESYNITAGKSKDAGDPYRKLTPDEIATLQRSVNNEYDEFVKYVHERRKIPEDVIRDKLGALTYDAKTAKEEKMIDDTMGREETYKALAEASRIGDDYEVVRPIVLDETARYQGGGWLGTVLHRGPKPASMAQASRCDLDRVTLAFNGDLSTLCRDANK